MKESGDFSLRGMRMIAITNDDTRPWSAGSAGSTSGLGALIETAPSSLNTNGATLAPPDDFPSIPLDYFPIRVYYRDMKKDTCKRCGHSWYRRKPEKPVKCPQCKSAYWDREKKG